jgi:hypothetical protein
MGLSSYRFKEFQKLDKIYPTGLNNDLDALKMFLKKIKEETSGDLKDEINKMENEMENDIVVDNVVLHSNIDYLDYASSLNALNLVYNSILISLCSFIETRLFMLCKLIEDKNVKSIKSINGESKIDTYKKYLEEVHSVDFNSVQNDWKQITSYAYLRNQFVHNQIPEINIDTNKTGYEKLRNIKFLNIKTESDFATFSINDSRLLDEYFDIISRFLQFICYIKN